MSEADEAAQLSTAKALHTALGNDPLSFLSSSSASVALGSSGLVVTADVDGSGTETDTAVATLKAGDSAGSSGGWNGMDYAHTNSGTKVANSAIVYTNRAEPKRVAFSATSSGLTETATDSGIYTVAAGVNADIGGDRFPSTGTQTYPTDAQSGVISFAGTYKNAAGTYLCRHATPCSAARSEAGISLTAGTWTFKPNADVMVSDPDDTYLYFGWWLRKNADGDPTHASAFSGSVGVNIPTDATRVPTSGKATYSGGAAGKFAIHNPLGESDSGHFTANVNLEASFAAAATDTSVSGTVSSFMANDVAVPWSIALNSGQVSTTGGITSPNVAGTTVNEGLSTVWSIDGTSGSTSGTWNGQM